MARTVGRGRPMQEGVGSGMKLSETVIFIVAGIAILFALKWYFIDYKKSPGVALGDYIAGIKSGNVERQYALLDAADKRLLPTQEDYEKKCPQARGYTERVTGMNFATPVPDAKDPTYCSIQATIYMRGPAGKDLIDNGQASEASDKYVLHKNSEGLWKISLTKGWPKNLLLQKPNPPGSSF